MPRRRPVKRSPDPLKPSTDQRALLQEIFDAWKRNGQWPKWNYIHYRMKAHGLDGAGVLRTMPYRLVNGLRMTSPTAGETASLTSLGLYYCKDASAEQEAFMTALRIALRADASFVPHHASTSGPVVWEGDLLSEGMPEPMLRPISEVLDHWIGVLSRQGRLEKMAAEWALSVSPEVERFASRSFGEYVAKVAEWLGPQGTGQAMRQIFVLMPFAETQAPIYRAIKAAVRAVKGYTCKRSDDITTPGRISFQIIEAIQRADLIVVDLANHNPNVMYELGFAHASGKPTILLAPERYTSPFDIHDWRYIEYSRTDLVRLTEKLTAWLQEPTILAKLPT